MDIAAAPIRARGEDWALDPVAVENARRITAVAMILVLGLYVGPAAVGAIVTETVAFFDKLSDITSNILFVPSF